MIRTEQVGNMASKSSANPKVRAHLLKLQRTLAEKNDVVMDGRDIGTTILPNAEVKSTSQQAQTPEQKEEHWNMNRREKPLTWTRSEKTSSSATNAT